MAITPYSKFYKRNSRGATPGDDDEEDNTASTMPIGKRPPLATTMPIKRKSTTTATTMPVGGKKPPTATTMPIAKRPVGTTMPVGKTKDALMEARAKAIQRRLRKSRQ